MLLQDIGGEFGFIERVRSNHANAPVEGLAIGIGDDAAVIAMNAGARQLVVTTDMLVEGIHFRRDWSDPYSIGWKAAAVNLSDIAAMGAVPTYSFVSVAVTLRETVENMDRLYDGFMDCLNRYGSRLAGGDTNASPDNLIISITQLGTVHTGNALTRSGARIGDIILATGTLGDSAAGLALLAEYGLAKAEKINKDLVNSHRRPQPRVVAAKAATATGKVHAAMDISDGLVADVQKLCNASGCGARIDSSSVPMSNALRETADMLHKDAIDVALAGGEDYELLLVVSPADVDELSAAVSEVGTTITAVGEIVKSGLRVIALNGADSLDAGLYGYDHFGK